MGVVGWSKYFKKDGYKTKGSVTSIYDKDMFQACTYKRCYNMLEVPNSAHVQNN